ncbi:Polyadenylate-binding protein-interacting protein 12 [Capsicum annuum]|nr:Polyadenylate-binding protein-interacting protein 12 [Capsicum annuum]
MTLCVISGNIGQAEVLIFFSIPTESQKRYCKVNVDWDQVVDCRVCGDPHSRLRFAFVEFADEYSAGASLNLCGTLVGFSPLKVLPSKTAILPVNPTFLPRSEDEREMCARTVYCTNIDKKVSQADVKNFFETRCGEVSRLRLLGDQVHSTRIAFVEFVMEVTGSSLGNSLWQKCKAESAIVALDCCGQILGSQPIRSFGREDCLVVDAYESQPGDPGLNSSYNTWVSPSKTPVRPRVPRSMMH